MRTDPTPTPNTTIDYEMSARLAARIEAELKGCYRNALLALLVSPDELGDCAYVEGTTIPALTGIPVDHAWIERPGPDGVTVIDPTLALWDALDERERGGEIRHAADGETVYVAGDRYPFKRAQRLIDRTLPLLPRLFSPAKQAAHEAAWASVPPETREQWEAIVDIFQAVDIEDYVREHHR